MTTPKPAHCCHAPTEPCAYGWSDTHFHRCAEDVRPVAAGRVEFEESKA